MKPKLSVVIATLGRNTLVPTLRSLIACRGGEAVEIVVVGVISDPTMADELQQLVSSGPLIKHLPLSFAVGDSSNKKNAGFSACTADIVAFIDDDVIVAGDWPDRVLEAFNDPDVGMVSGPSLVPNDLPLMARLAGNALSSLAAGYVAKRYLKGDRGPHRISWSGIIGCNMAFMREALEMAGGFDPQFWPGEEMVVSSTMEKLGYAIVFAPDAWLYHYPRASFRGFAVQIYKYGATRIRLIRKGVGLEPTTLLPAILLLSIVVLGIGARFSTLASDMLTAELLIYLVFVMVATIALIARTKRISDSLVFFLIPVMHLSYAVAQLVELVFPGRDLSDPARSVPPLTP